MKCKPGIVIAVVISLLTAQAGFAGEKEPAKAKAFYNGKTINWMIGSSPGGSVDGTSRLTAPFFEKYTGAKIVLQNRPAGSGVGMFNHLYNRTRPDGLTVGWHLGSTQTLSRVSGRAGIQYDLEKLHWIGVVAPTENTLLAYKPRFKSLQDLKRADKPLQWGLTRLGGNNYFIGLTLREVLGLNVRFVPGYRGSASVRQALMSGEVDVAAYGANLYAAAIKDGLVVPLLHIGQRRAPAAPDTPTLYETVKNIPQPLDSWIRIGEVGYFMATNPGVPKERVEFLRWALRQVTRDREFTNQAKKKGYVIGYLSPDEAFPIVRKLLHPSQKDREKLDRMLKGE